MATPNWARRDAAAARRQQALALRAAGASLRRVAEQLGVFHVQIVRDLRAVLGEMAEGNEDNARQLRPLMTAHY